MLLVLVPAVSLRAGGCGMPWRGNGNKIWARKIPLQTRLVPSVTESVHRLFLGIFETYVQIDL